MQNNTEITYYDEYPEEKAKDALASLAKKPSSLLSLGSLIKNAISVIEESLEGLSIAYSTYIIFAYDPNWETKYGYGFVLAGGLTGGITEILHLNEIMSNKQHHQYRMIKEAIAGSAVAAIFTEDFLPPNLETVAIGGATLFVLTTSKALIEIFNKRPFFHSIAGKLIEYPVGGIYNLLAGAGICDYLFSICEGFGAEVSPNLKFGFTGGLSILTLLADLPLSKFKPHDSLTHASNADRYYKNLCYKPAHAFRSSLYGAEIGLFLSIFLFDVITDIQQSTVITNAVFYSVIATAVVQGGIVMINKLKADNKEEHAEDHAEEEIHSMKYHAKKEDNHSRFSVRALLNCCHNFWQKSDDQSAKIDAYIAGTNITDIQNHPEPAKGTFSFPSFTWLKSCFQRTKENHSSYEVIKEKDHPEDKRIGYATFNG